MNPRAHITDSHGSAVLHASAPMFFAAGFIPAKKTDPNYAHNSHPGPTRTVTNVNKGNLVKHSYSYMRWGINE
jgi:hypothetical protein